MLRIRPNNATIRELNIPKEKLEVLEKVVTSPQTTDDIKKIDDKEICRKSPCYVCGGIPSLEVVYDADGASLVERYCEACANRVFSKNATPSKSSLVKRD